MITIWKSFCQSPSHPHKHASLQDSKRAAEFAAGKKQKKEDGDGGPHENDGLDKGPDRDKGNDDDDDDEPEVVGVTPAPSPGPPWEDHATDDKAGWNSKKGGIRLWPTVPLLTCGTS